MALLKGSNLLPVFKMQKENLKNLKHPGTSNSKSFPELLMTITSLKFNQKWGDNCSSWRCFVKREKSLDATKVVILMFQTFTTFFGSVTNEVCQKYFCSKNYLNNVSLTCKVVVVNYFQWGTFEFSAPVAFSMNLRGQAPHHHDKKYSWVIKC